ncbi:hypothetical protein BKA80DRAFT_91637 [Phyllosticta citrichinensis]
MWNDHCPLVHSLSSLRKTLSTSNRLQPVDLHALLRVDSFSLVALAAQYYNSFDTRTVHKRSGKIRCSNFDPWLVMPATEPTYPKKLEAFATTSSKRRLCPPSSCRTSAGRNLMVATFIMQSLASWESATSTKRRRPSDNDEMPKVALFGADA